MSEQEPILNADSNTVTAEWYRPAANNSWPTTCYIPELSKFLLCRLLIMKSSPISQRMDSGQVSSLAAVERWVLAYAGEGI